MTTDHTDLIARLRALSRRGYWPLIGDEAADAIKAQAARIAELEAERDAAMADAERLRTTATQVLRDMQAQDLLIEWQSELDAAINASRVQEQAK